MFFLAEEHVLRSEELEISLSDVRAATFVNFLECTRRGTLALLVAHKALVDKHECVGESLVIVCGRKTMVKRTCRVTRRALRI